MLQTLQDFYVLQGDLGHAIFKKSIFNFVLFITFSAIMQKDQSEQFFEFHFRFT